MSLFLPPHLNDHMWSRKDLNTPNSKWEANCNHTTWSHSAVPFHGGLCEADAQVQQDSSHHYINFKLEGIKMSVWHAHRSKWFLGLHFLKLLFSTEWLFLFWIVFPLMSDNRWKIQKTEGLFYLQKGRLWMLLLRALPSIQSTKRSIEYLVLAGVANSIANWDGDSFCYQHLLEGTRQKCTTVTKCRKLSDTTVSRKIQGCIKMKQYHQFSP